MSKINRQTLVKTLNLLRPGLSNKDILEGGQCFNFHKDTIVTFNDIMSISIPLKTGIEGAIKAEEFYKLLDKITADELTLTRKENEIRVVAGKVRAGLQIHNKVIPPQPVNNGFEPLPTDFKQAINFCQFSASRDMTRPHLTCLHIQGNKISCSDNWRITQMIMADKSPYDFLLPAETVQHLVKYNLTHVALDKAWVHFGDEESGLTFSCRLKMADFINVDKFFEVDGAMVRLPEGLVEAIDRVKIMVDGDSDLDLQVKLHLENNKLTIRGQKEIGWVEEEIAIDYDDKPAIFQANPIFLAEILSRTKEMRVNDRLCFFWGENFRHVMMLIGK